MARIGMKAIREGRRVPRFSGVIRYDPCLRTVLVLPIPLNLLARWGASALIRARATVHPAWWERQIGTAERAAYNDGFAAGYASKTTHDQHLLETMRDLLDRSNPLENS